MLYGDRNDMRQVFVDTYRKTQAGMPLAPMEQVIAAVIAEHPEYHKLLGAGDIDRDYTVEQGQTNPFLHMAMHISIREQLSVDRPAGISAAWQRLSLREGDAHQAEHRMLDCLAEMLIEAQRSGSMPDEQAYLRAVQQLL
ncbi:MAG: DUF1841 family protein [Gammaproteobacteria bacterium]|nr:DUF1841 family protein [Gammaproteobacteria bacterium]NNF60240.1 DUF1841 family protein [Gammaproteobacteria bacterium]NNM20348.1 DUF1841 family protein [Gammaproteobacteria bacterium]